MRNVLLTMMLLLGVCACSSDATPEGTPTGLPRELPFAFTRPDVGSPLTDQEITDFTVKMTGFWRSIDYFTWVYETCHGMDASTGYPDYSIWWHDIDAVKEGDTVTFVHNPAHGGSHNNAQPTGEVLIQAMGAYLLSQDEASRRIVEQFAKSFTALAKGFVYDDQDPLLYLQSRNIVTHNHAFQLPSGKSKTVDYSAWYTTYEGWNADRVHYPNNPTWGDIYVTTMRSKDDVPYMYRAAAWFPYVLELTDDETLYDAVAEAQTYLQGFAADIVDSGYLIRSKDADGQPFVPEEDLASFVAYTSLFPDAECDARLSTALLAAGDPLGIDCGTGDGSQYDALAGSMHYYNYAIVNLFYLAALQLALTGRHDAMAEQLLRGFVTRLERYQDPNTTEAGADHENWERDIALLLVKGASMGMPLTAAEVRKVHQVHGHTVDVYEQFPTWDLWSSSVPDGTYDFRSGFHPADQPDAIKIEDIGYLLEYCGSPFRNPAGAKLIDCDVVADPSRWGEG